MKARFSFRFLSREHHNNNRYYILALPVILVCGYFLGVYLPPERVGSNAVIFYNQIPKDLWFYILAGFVAQMIDGALGMAYGVTASSFLLSMGVSPSASSASVHTAEIATSGVSGLMHLRFGNVNTKLFKLLLLPGVLGAIVGAYLLSYAEQYNYIIKPIVSFYTLFLGYLILMKALKRDSIRKRITNIPPLAFVGGLLDSIGGGGWGPIVSSTLIARGRHPKYTIGSANLAEFFVAFASALTFITVIGLSHWTIIIGLILGGVIAAPIAAYFAHKIPMRTMMILVSIVIIVISLKRILF